jgi:hypothetical protein
METHQSVHRKRETCRACGGRRLRPFLSLGRTPLANAFLRSAEEFASEAFYPLDVYRCDTCSLVQLSDVIHAEALFRNYIYVTGTSETMARHNVQYARAVVDQLRLESTDLVIEIASNDGSLLQCFKQHGVRTLGVEPALNVAQMAIAGGIETITPFFDFSTARQIRDSYGPAKGVIGNNVLAHVDDTRDFLHGCKALLDKNGLVIIEVPYLCDLVDKLEYDTIYHEHLCYFSVGTLLCLCDAVGLSVVRMDHVDVHGGSLRMYAGRTEDYGPHKDAVRTWAKQESELGLTSFGRLQNFAADVDRNRRALLQLLSSLKQKGETIAGYGAPAKSTTLLNYCGINSSVIACTVDRNPMKVGLFTPGVHIPVLPVSILLERQPAYVLILAWNFADEIMEQQEEYAARGGRFIVPIPEPKVVTL